MIQLNLLPDVKLHFMQANRLRRTTILASFIVTAGALALFVFLFLTVNVWQKAHIRNLGKDINSTADQLKNTASLNRILTVQQQLKSLPELHAQKPAAKRLLSFVTQVTPASVTISKLTISFEDNSLEVGGDSARLENINKFVDTLKFTSYQVSDAESELKPAFSNVVLSTFGRDAGEATYVINLSFDPLIFDSKLSALKLVVPKDFITTRSETERPGALFEAADEGALINPGEGN